MDYGQGFFSKKKMFRGTLSVACSMLKDVPFFVRRTALLVSLYITKHLFLPTYAT